MTGSTPNGSPHRPDGDRNVIVSQRYRFRAAAHVLSPDCPVLADLMPAEVGPARVLVILDEGLTHAAPWTTERVQQYAEAHGDRLTLAGPIEVVAGGEQTKNDWATYERVVRAIHDGNLCRHSYVLAIGGGAVLDAVGFAAATAHRGVRLVRMPTTTLAQADAGIGVKNGINAFGKKNFLGTFTVPWAVVNDPSLPATLSDREWRCGFSEAVKVALVKDASLFERIESAADSLGQRDEGVARSIIQHSAELHLDHIVDGGDPFELTVARPLDFGHWSAHKLEQMTGFRLRHGEAVAIGVALDSLYSALAGLLAWDDAVRVVDTLKRIGFSLYDDALQNTSDLLDGLDEFREHLGGRLTIAMIDSIGVQRDVHDMDRAVLADAIDRLRGTSLQHL